MVLAERAFFLSCSRSRLRLWIFSVISLVMFSLVILRRLNFSFGNLASRLMRFLRLILARDSGVPFFDASHGQMGPTGGDLRRELRRPSDGMVASSDDMAVMHYNARP